MLNSKNNSVAFAGLRRKELFKLAFDTIHLLGIGGRVTLCGYIRPFFGIFRIESAASCRALARCPA